MIAVSDARRQQLTDYRGDWLISLAFTLSSGETLTVTRDNVWGGSLALEDAVGSSGSFEIGSTHINQMKVTLFDDDGAYDSKNFLNASVIVNLGWHSGSLLVKGYYTIVDVQKSDGLIALVGYDYMDKFSRPYSLSTRTYPCTLKQIVAEACTFCGVTDGTGNFGHYKQTIQTKPNDDMLTFREVIGYVAQIAGYNARIARDGRLRFVRYNLAGFDTEGAYNTVADVYSDRIEQDEINITGIHVDEENAVTTTDSEGIKTTSLVTTGYDAGTDGYVLSVSGNPLIKNGLGQNVANWLFSAFGNKPFRIGSVTHASDPCIEASDIMKVTDRHGTYNMLVSETTFSTGSPQTSNSYATSPRSTDAVQYSNLDKIKTVASEAHLVALAAQGYANEAQRSANAAQASADSAATAAQTAWNHADDANTAAQTAWNRAGDALTAAGNAQSSADAAATAASNAQTSASNAQTSADNAQAQANLATGYADDALIQLSEIEQVANILNWISQHGSYTKTTDTAVVKDKNYYTKSGNVYTLVTEPDVADIGNYYELHIDEAISNYVSTHLALTNDGLYVIKGANDYRVRITNNAFQVLDANGNQIATYGTSIYFDPTKEFTIGNSSNYFKFFDSDSDGIADSIAIIANQIVLGNKNVGDAIDDLENMEIGGRNLIHNTNTIDLSSTASRPNINGDSANGYATGAAGGTFTAAEHGVRHTVTTAQRPGIVFGQNNVSIGLHGLATGRTYTWSFDYTMKTFSGTPPTTSNYRLRAYFGYVPEGSSAYNTSTYKDIYVFYTSDLSDRGAEISGHGEFTFELPEGATAMRFWVTTNSANTSYYASGDFVELRNIKLEEGNMDTAWTPAPEDIDSDISNVEINLANTKTALEDDIYGDIFWQYTTGGTTYDVWLDESTGNYTYVDGNGDMATVAYANLDVDTETGEKATTRKGGMLDNIEVINGSILIDNNEPSVTIQAVKQTNSGTVLGDSKLKLLSERISFEKNGTEVMYLDSTEDDGVIDINSARVHNSLKIGHLELFEHNGGIGIRRWS